MDSCQKTGAYIIYWSKSLSDTCVSPLNLALYRISSIDPKVTHILKVHINDIRFIGGSNLTHPHVARSTSELSSISLALPSLVYEMVSEMMKVYGYPS